MSEAEDPQQGGGESTFTVIVAAVANLGIAVAKAVADTEFLLLTALKRSEKPADEDHRSCGLSGSEPTQPHAPNGLGRTGPQRAQPRGGDTHPVRGPGPGGPRDRRSLTDAALRDPAKWARPEATGKP